MSTTSIKDNVWIFLGQITTKWANLNFYKIITSLFLWNLLYEIFCNLLLNILIVAQYIIFLLIFIE
jgi:hypothetical protein